MVMQKSGEDYLESILKLSNEISNVRAIDVVRDLDFSKPSVSIALKKLKDDGYITIDNNQYIHLTEKGYEVAKKIYDRHELIASILIKLGVSEEQAYIDSCKIEHDISPETFEALKKVKF